MANVLGASGKADGSRRFATSRVAAGPLTALRVPPHAPSDLANLEMETRPEDVLAEIERLQRRARQGDTEKE